MTGGGWNKGYIVRGGGAVRKQHEYTVGLHSRVTAHTSCTYECS